MQGERTVKRPASHDAWVRWRTVCDLACQLPEVLVGKSYGVPVLYVRGSFMARRSDDGRSILVKASDHDRQLLSVAKPQTFEPGGDHWSRAILTVRLAVVERDELWDVLVAAWRMSAPPSLVRSVDPSTLRN